ncbi:MAG: S-methyl-5'-thioinosine phosphorylase [Gammaproteobacteria bacterium]
MNKIAIIGGTGLTSLAGVEINETREVETPYGSPSSALSFGTMGDKEIIFLPRHGNPHAIPPHKINYRANIYALKENGVKNIIAVNAVGGITSEMHPERIVVPEQIIDYTYGRKHTFFEDKLDEVTHIDFTNPYSVDLREQLTSNPVILDLNVFVGGVYAATQGPRLETAAEVDKLEKDGCDIVGMTGMPETALARELNINYVCLSLVVNWAAGKSDEEITMAVIEKHLEDGMEKVKLLLEKFITAS